ncbi:MAG: sulfatase-like hydrolase/transferase [Cytophagales bacterium]|nr:sulfatase-like hydrolase/transferase [Cytophagales bacterium]
MASILLAIITGFVPPDLSANRSTYSKPNVIIIYTDDQGTLDMNCYGSKDLFTPNMDRLAENGVRFTQFYAASSICSPSRAALLTGKTPLAAGMNENSPSAKGKGGLPTEQLTVAEALRENGYVTAHIGKWHLGYSPETMPNGQGFDYSFGHMGGCIDNYSHFYHWHGANRHDLWENDQEVWRDGVYFQDLMADKVDSFLIASKEKPFFLYYAINLPHYPLQGTAKWRAHYQNLPHPRDKYAAAISTVDELIGRMLNRMEELGLLDETIIIFQSDHGHSVEERTFSGGGNAGPYRGAKFSFFEGGIRVPALISWPKVIPKGLVRDQVGINTDWFPTILDLCGIGPIENLEGKTLKKVILTNDDSPHQEFWWHQSETHWAVRKGDWKLYKNPRDPTGKVPLDEKDSLFLVNLVKDPGERTNVAAQHPGKVARLLKVYQDWYAQFD